MQEERRQSQHRQLTVMQFVMQWQKWTDRKLEKRTCYIYDNGVNSFGPNDHVVKTWCCDQTPLGTLQTETALMHELWAASGESGQDIMCRRHYVSFCHILTRADEPLQTSSHYWKCLEKLPGERAQQAGRRAALISEAVLTCLKSSIMLTLF